MLYLVGHLNWNIVSSPVNDIHFMVVCDRFIWMVYTEQDKNTFSRHDGSSLSLGFFKSDFWMKNCLW